MPVFSTRPSAGLTTSIRRMLSGSGLSPLDEARADSMAAQTAHHMGLAEKARAEVLAMRRAEAARSDPDLAAEYAGHVSGMDVPTARRMSNHLRGILEQPGSADIEDAAGMGRDAQPFVTAAPNVDPAARRVFQSALASTIANRLATGKTNAEQLAHAGDRINETALTNTAANTADVPTANRIIAAVAGKIREPFKLGAQGQVLNEETGALNEGTDVTRSNIGLTTARTATEGARQGELGTRSRLNVARIDTEGARQGALTASAGLSTARAGAVERGADRGGARVTPQQVERWASEVARKEWDTIPASQRRGMNYEQHLAKVRERFKGGPTGGNAQTEITDAHAALAKGADPAKVAKRFKERMGFDLPAPARAAPAAAATEEEED